MDITESDFYKENHHQKKISAGRTDSNFTEYKSSPGAARARDTTTMISNPVNTRVESVHQPMDVAGILSDFAQAGM